MNLKRIMLALMAGGLAFGLSSCRSLEKKAEGYVSAHAAKRGDNSLITEADLADLPDIVKRHFEYTGLVGSPKISDFSLIMEGRIQMKQGGRFMKLQARQYNNILNPARFYYIKAKGFPMRGLDSYQDGIGRMEIALFGIKVADSTGDEMSRSGLVTFLNDMIFCPQAYFSLPLVWEKAGENQAWVSLTHEGMTVRGLLTFDEEGKLILWESWDRYAEVGGEMLKDHWIIKISEYRRVNGLNIPVRGEGQHDYGTGVYTYFMLDDIAFQGMDTGGLPE